MQILHYLCYNIEKYNNIQVEVLTVSYNELQPRGTYELPMELYKIDKDHPKYEMAYHWHGEFEIIRIIEGSLRITLNNRELDVVAGEVIFVNSETVHGAIPDGCVYECIVFARELLLVDDKICGNFISDLLDFVVVINDHLKQTDGEIIDKVNNLFQIMNRNGCYFEVVGALYGVLGIIIRDKLFKYASGLDEGNTVGNAKLKKVLSYIRKSYDRQISLEQMAEVVAMSPKYFCHFFKEMTKKSAISYLNTYRVERAAKKLITTDISVTDIAYSCGFNDLSYFIKTFKKIKGITPNNFRKKGE